MKNGEVLQVVERLPEGKYLAATVFENGQLGDRRIINSRQIHDSAVISGGRVRRTGYAPTCTIPQGHPYFVSPEQAMRTVPVMADEINFEAMDDAALLAFANKIQAQAASLTDMFEKAKDEMRSRQPRAGVTVHNGVTLEAQYKRKFNPGRANDLLSREQIRRITVEKLDGPKAKALLSAEDYEKVSDAQKPAIAIRFATEKDLEKVAEAALEDSQNESMDF
jgi:hypothetical protein